MNSPPPRILCGCAPISSSFGLSARRILSAAALGVSLLCSPLNAQRTSPPAASLEEESVTELSPFVVTSESDSGYAATNTLAGTRLNTPIKDIGTAISVVT